MFSPAIHAPNFNNLGCENEECTMEDEETALVESGNQSPQQVEETAMSSGNKNKETRKAYIQPNNDDSDI